MGSCARRQKGGQTIKTGSNITTESETLYRIVLSLRASDTVRVATSYQRDQVENVGALASSGSPLQAQTLRRFAPLRMQSYYD